MKNECSEKLNGDQLMQIGRLCSSENFVCKRQKLVFVNFKPVKRFENWDGMRELEGINNSTSKRVLNLLKSI